MVKQEEKIYHIYAKNHCIYHSLNEEQFTETWDMIHKLLSITGHLSSSDITYEELSVNKEIIANSSH